MMIRIHTHLWWHELNCHDVRAAIAFHGRVNGWKFDAIALENGNDYWIGRRNGVPVCGIRQLDPERHADVPPHWMTYMAVPDLGAAVRAALFSGGTLVRQPHRVPGLGELAVITDPLNCLLGLIKPETGHPLMNAPIGELASARRPASPQPLPAH